MGIFSNRVEKNELEAGDHVYTWRAGFIYSHHGIYMGEGKVIHFTQDSINFQLDGKISIACPSKTSTICSACEAIRIRLTKLTSGVIVSCLNCFLGTGSLYRFQYGVSMLAFVFKLRGGTCHFANCDPAQVAIDRAMNLLEKRFGEYHVFANNCEDFAYFRKTGQKCSRDPSCCQVSSSIGGTAAALCNFYLQKRACHAN